MTKILLIPVAAFLLIQCESKNLTIPKNSVGGTITTAEQETTIVYDNEKMVSDFNVKVESINDSRCPTGLACAWAGFASVGFVVESNTFSLNIGESKTFLVSTSAFKIKLKDVIPYPIAPSPKVKKYAVYGITHI